jgi:hypothetical protein
MGSLKFAGLLGELLVVSHTLAAVCCTWLGESFPNMRWAGTFPVTCLSLMLAGHLSLQNECAGVKCSCIKSQCSTCSLMKT